MLILLSVLVPLVFGAVLSFIYNKSAKGGLVLLFAGEAVTLAGVIALIFTKESDFTLFSLWNDYPLRLSVDKMGLLFALLGVFIFSVVSVFAVKYISEEEHVGRFFSFFLAGLGAYVGMCFASNLLSFYLFFEALTLTTFPLVLHEQTPEAILGAKKYLFYSMGGAILALGGILVLLSGLGIDVDSFASGCAGGISTTAKIGIFLTIVGFSAKAGMFPLQSWLPSAHPVCPAPASALLSGLIVKAGILGILRVSYFTVSAEEMSGSVFQTILLCLALFTVVCASTRAYFEPVFKKRLAYSTVSNLSYILCGLFLFSPAGLDGALFHTVAHALAKTALFLCAGEIIFRSGKTKVKDLAGLGKKMPVVFVLFLISAFSLVGIPPMAGFLSKWYLCEGALADAPGAFAYIIPGCLLLSALLTAGYLFKPVISAFYARPGKDGDNAGTEGESEPSSKEPSDNDTPVRKGSALFTVPLLLLSVGGLLFGFVNPLSDLILSIF